MHHYKNYERNHYIEGNPEVKTEVKTETPQIFFNTVLISCYLFQEDRNCINHYSR